MPKDSEKETLYAKAIAIRYLSHAPRSTKEVELKLKGKDVTSDTLKETIRYLIDRGYINDELFAKNWISSKIKSRLWGKNRIIQGLKQKGISPDIIKEALDNSEVETTEFNTADIALKKWLKTQKKHLLGIQNSKLMTQKAFRHLKNKGFSTSAIITAIKKYDGEFEIYEGQ